MTVVGKTVVVTGAGSGIGRATALRFARAGARVAACDVDQGRLDTLARELGDRVIAVRKVDVSDRAQMSGFADVVHAAAGAADVLVNNAGVGLVGAFVDTKLDDIDWLLGVNLRGVVHGCHFFVPKMVERKTGHVINLSSILGIAPAENLSAYVTSKFAVLGFTQSLRAELAPHKIGVTAICPGLIDTSIAADGRSTDALKVHRAKTIAHFKTGMSPDVVADVIFDAVRTNPAIRTVGRTAWTIRQLIRIAPETAKNVFNRLQRTRAI